jgi:hypothetical protein
LCKYDWLLNLDADESLTPELYQTIKHTIQNPNAEITAYQLRRKLCFFHEKSPRKLAPYDKPIRLYHKKHASFHSSSVHDTVQVETGKVGILDGILIHRCFLSLEQWVMKINRYSSLQADDYLLRKRSPSTLRIFIEPLFAFWKAYLLRRWFVYGIDGIISARLYAFGRMLRMAKIREQAAHK